MPGMLGRRFKAALVVFRVQAAGAEGRRMLLKVSAEKSRCIRVVRGRMGSQGRWLETVWIS